MVACLDPAQAASRKAKPAPVQPQPAPASGGFDGVLESLHLKAKLAPAPDFVTRTRPDEDKLHYMPVGAPHPERAIKVKTSAEIAATEAELDAARMAQQRRAGFKPAPIPTRPAKAAGRAAPKTDR